MHDDPFWAALVLPFIKPFLDCAKAGFECAKARYELETARLRRRRDDAG